MVRKAIIVVAAMLSGTPATAQTHTQCYRLGQYVDCDTTTRKPLDLNPTDYLSALGGVDNLPNPAREVQAQPAAVPEQLQRSWAHLADLIRAHKCEDAIDFAIRQGGTEAGLRTRALCQ